MTRLIINCRFLASMVILACASGAIAGDLAVQVVDADGAPVPDVAVFVKAIDGAVDPTRKPVGAVMDQRDARFVPHILVIEKGAAVEFPNSDIVAHHVYSFSRPNDFVLPLYKGHPPQPIVFEQDGVVTLGCNIHDGMLAYIIVVDTNVFATTDETGAAMLKIEDGAAGYEVRIWSPRIRDSKEPLLVKLSGSPVDKVTFKLEKSLRLAHVEESDSVEWAEY